MDKNEMTQAPETPTFLLGLRKSLQHAIAAFSPLPDDTTNPFLSLTRRGMLQITSALAALPFVGEILPIKMREEAALYTNPKQMIAFQSAFSQLQKLTITYDTYKKCGITERRHGAFLLALELFGQDTPQTNLHRDSFTSANNANDPKRFSIAAQVIDTLLADQEYLRRHSAIFYPTTTNREGKDSVLEQFVRALQTGQVKENLEHMRQLFIKEIAVAQSELEAKPSLHDPHGSSQVIEGKFVQRLGASEHPSKTFRHA